MRKLFKMILNWFEYHDEKAGLPLSPMEEIDTYCGANYLI